MIGLGNQTTNNNKLRIYLAEDRMVAAYLRAILRAESDAAITYSVLDNLKWWKCHVLIDRIMASIVPIMSTKLAIPYRVIYMLPIHISIHIDNVALVWSQHQTCLSGGVIISAVFNVLALHCFTKFCHTSAHVFSFTLCLNLQGWENVGWGVTGT